MLEKLINAYAQGDRFSLSADYSENLQGVMLIFSNQHEGFENWSERLTDKDTNNPSRLIQREVNDNMRTIMDEVFEIA